MAKINKKILIGVLVAVILIFSGIICLIFYQRGKILQKKEEMKKEETKEEILERLTPKELEPLTPEEQEEQEKLLEQLTPSQAKPMTSEQQKELEELLKKLTPQ